MPDLKPLTPKQFINRSNNKKKPHRIEFDEFKSALVNLLNSINEPESEDHNKTYIRTFLKSTFYKSNEINTKSKNDLVIFLGATAKSKAGVLIEVKHPNSANSKREMITKENLDAKAMHEVILYYLRERIEEKNDEVKQIIITNTYEWFIFDAHLFEKHFHNNSVLKKEYETWVQGGKVSNTTEHFYNEIAPRAIEFVEKDFEFVHFDIRDYKNHLKRGGDEKNLIPLYKIFSRNTLLKEPFANDSNELDKQFYQELLHIIGLEEIKQGSKKIIDRKANGRREDGSLIENTINKLKTKDILRHIPKPETFGSGVEEQYYNIALELCITWINRVLFLKLLEAQLIKYNNGSLDFKFLDEKFISQFDDLHELFHEVLARKPEERTQEVNEKFGSIPYLNSSLFEISDLERNSVEISGLKDRLELSLFKQTILKKKDKKQAGELSTLEYLLKFLDAYDFSSESSGEEILPEEKRLISASVLGLIFEKINGYKEGSFFTPGFITMYMCRETLRHAVLQKFKEKKDWDCATFDDLRDKIDYHEKEARLEANDIINQIKICDPAAGSGHFLVSALNELIAIKSELGILCYRDGSRIKDYNVTIGNDELVVKDVETEEDFEYRLNEKGNPIEPLQKMQEALFHEKETIIENCLFGVDINPNSVNICRLRLWIELLKNAYYDLTLNPSPNLGEGLLKPLSLPRRGAGVRSELQTLPNIDINIKLGNSLISRFKLDTDLKKALKTIKYTIQDYKSFVQGYRTAKTKDEKRNFASFIDDIKKNFRHEINTNDPRRKKLNELAYELHTKFETERLIDVQLSANAKKKLKAEEEKLKSDIEKKSKELEAEESGEIFRNAFEWRFEFPEVLNDEGDFIGFDVVIGNPPYISLSKLKGFDTIFENYLTYNKTADIYCLFYERGWQVLKEKGLLTYITSNSWMRTKYGEQLRKFFVEKTNPKILVNIEDVQLFDEAVVESNVLTISKGKCDNELKYHLIKNITDENIWNNTQHEFQIITELGHEGWSLGTKDENNLKNKIECNSVTIKDNEVAIYYGIKTGFNDAFFINGELKDQLINDHGELLEFFKPVIRGKDISKYHIDLKDLWLVLIKNGWTNSNLESNDKETTIKEKFPSLYNHFISVDKNKGKGKGLFNREDQGDYWWELRPCAYYDDFEKEKIIWGELSDKPKFAYDDGKHYSNNTIFFMVGKNLKYILAILNSKLSEWYFNQISTSSGMGTNRWLKYKVELLPIKDKKETEQKPLIKLVDKIIEEKKSNPQTDTSELEREIDRLVYELYELTEEEIKIVEGTQPSTLKKERVLIPPIL